MEGWVDSESPLPGDIQLLNPTGTMQIEGLGVERRKVPLGQSLLGLDRFAYRSDRFQVLHSPPFANRCRTP